MLVIIFNLYNKFKFILFLGPLDNGTFVPVTVQSIHRNKAPCRVVKATQSASLSLEKVIPGLRNGMVLLGLGVNHSACMFFQVWP